MFIKSKTQNKLQEEIDSALDELSQNRGDYAEYNALVERIAKLQKLKTEHGLKPPSPDTVLIVGANLVGILWLTAVERDTPITTKALNFVLRPK